MWKQHLETGVEQLGLNSAHPSGLITEPEQCSGVWRKYSVINIIYTVLSMVYYSYIRNNICINTETAVSKFPRQFQGCAAYSRASKLNHQLLFFNSRKMFSSDSWTEPGGCCSVYLSHSRLALNVRFKWEFHVDLGWLPFSRHNSQGSEREAQQKQPGRASVVLISDRKQFSLCFLE